MAKTTLTNSNMTIPSPNVTIKIDSTPRKVDGSNITTAYKNSPGPRDQTGSQGS